LLQDFPASFWTLTSLASVNLANNRLY